MTADRGVGPGARPDVLDRETVGSLTREDLETVARAAGQLRGSFAAVGATQMSGLAAQIEPAAIENHPEQRAVPVSQMEGSFKSAAAALRAAANAALRPQGVGD